MGTVASGRPPGVPVWAVEVVKECCTVVIVWCGHASPEGRKTVDCVISVCGATTEPL